jgi:hypothetical protein
MNEAASMAGRDGRGRFQPGLSGNPAGKAPGTRNHSTRFRLLLEDGDFEAAGRLIIERARAGNLAAARFIVDHVDPKPRGRAVALDVASDSSLVERYAALTRAMLAGELSPQEAAAMARLLEREAALRAREPAPVRAAAAPVPAPHPEPAPDLHSACIVRRHDPAPRRRDVTQQAGDPDWRAAVSQHALTAGGPASGLHPAIVSRVAAGDACGAAAGGGAR